jgi:hypothetical protein
MMEIIAFFLLLAVAMFIYSWCFDITGADRRNIKNRLRDWWRTE